MNDRFSVGSGSILFHKNFTNVHPNISISYKANKGTLFVSLLLGQVKAGEQYETDVEKLLNALGYYRKEHE